VAAFNRSVVYVGVAVLVTVLLRRERALAGRVRAQQDELVELASLRAALTPVDVPARPYLDLATSFTPADGLVAGDFFLVVDGPSGGSTVAVGDVVGHGLDAARCAAFVRAALTTFARFTSDPVELLQLANAALVEHDRDTQFVTAVCLTIGPPPACEVVWASAGHDVPWLLDTGTVLPGGRVGAPLGIGADALQLEAGRFALAPGTGLLVFTDGLLEGRPARRHPERPMQLFGEERARRVVREHRGAPAQRVLDALVAEVTEFAGGPLADDLCLVAVRAEGRRRTDRGRSTTVPES
jgi:serine phosphatase RsbU (regulator of sigma subunit)